METFKVGDTIRFSNEYDLIDNMKELAWCGIETDFLYEKDGERGLWLIVTEVKDGRTES